MGTRTAMAAGRHLRVCLVGTGAALTALGAAAAPASAQGLGERPLAPLRAWGEETGRQLAQQGVTSTAVARRLAALDRTVTRVAPRLRASTAPVRSAELARTRVALGDALDPLAGSLRGTTRELFFIAYQHQLERLAISARLDRTPTGRPLELTGGRAAAALTATLRPDTDGDGASDVDELDDDGDGIVDRRDGSDQGWGIPDALQVREDLDDDADEDGTPDVRADSLQGLRGGAEDVVSSGRPTALRALAGAGSGAYCLLVTEPVPALRSIGATRNLLDVARARGCRPPTRVAAPKRRRASRSGPRAVVRDATASGRRLLMEVQVERPARLDVAVVQRVVSGRADAVRYDERRSRRANVRAAAGRRVLAVPLGTDLAAGRATATISVRPRAGGAARRLVVPVTVPGTVRAGVAVPPSPVAGTSAPERAPGPARLVKATSRGADEVVLTFDAPVGPSAEDVANYRTTPNLFLTGAARLAGLTEVVLKTGPQYAVPYVVDAGAVADAAGSPIDPTAARATFTGTVALDGERPRVTSAGSTGNTSVLVQFSTALADSALDAGLYSITRDSATIESGGVAVQAARFRDASRTLVELTTGSQSEVPYRVRVTGIVDLAGRPLADRTGGTLAVDPTTAVFSGTPPAGGTSRDTDCDGLTDDAEAIGYRVVVLRADGKETVRDVTSDPGRPGLDCENPAAVDDRNGDGTPDSADTDGDGLTDDVERGLAIDPRDADTDDDALTDFSEYNEIFSEPLEQDTDGDALTDGLEATFFITSALLTDTDGDQLTDDAELTLGNRNARIGDLPRPALEIGAADLRLDVRFTDVTGTEQTVVDTKSVASKLQQTEAQKFGTTDRRTIEAGTKLTEEVGFEAAWGADAGVKASFKATAEQSFSSQFVSEWTKETSSETQKAYESSLASAVQQAESANRTRTVEGARMQVAVDLRAVGDIAFTLRNLQVTALVQDPQQPTRLTPVATLLPAAGQAEEYNLGPLMPERGPIVLESTQVFPAQIEELMRNPRGLLFRFSNYDITDELGRNFAYTSQAINDRTAGLIIDFGGFDSDGDGTGDETENRRVATGTGRVVDTDEDGEIGDGDRRVVYDARGRQVGITLRDALAAIGLTEYVEADTPTSSLTQEQIDSSYSIIRRPDGSDRIHRVRRTDIGDGDRRSWEIIGPNGIDRTLGLDELILNAGETHTLAFLQDDDRDGVPAIVENLNSCTDAVLDSDGDGLDDRFEIYVGWEVKVERGTRQARSRCASDDTDNDGLLDGFEAPSVIQRDADGLIRFTTGNEPKRDTTGTPEPVIDHALNDPVTDPTSRDTDLDGLADAYELTERTLPLRAGGTTGPIRTSPEHFDSDADTASDGVEERAKGNPRDDGDRDDFSDDDGDGLVNVVETTPDYSVTVFKRPGGSCESVCAGDGAPETTTGIVSHANDPDSDDDGLPDGEERARKLHPGKPDTDGDGLGDREEVQGFTLRDLGLITTDPLREDTDRDQRLDGVEAGRTGTAIVVRVPGEDPYVSHTDPRNPDEDLDILVDGDEARNGTDARKANTDGDNQSDFEEIRSTLGGKQRRPLVPDLYVEVTLAGLDVKSDGDGADSAGDFEFGLTIRNPAGVRICDPSVCVNGPGQDLRPFPVNSHRDGGIDLDNCGDGEQLSTCRQSDRRIQARDDRGEIPFRRTIPAGSVSISPKKYESFQFDGFMQEFEGDEVDCNIVFPNPLKADESGGESGIFPGSTLEPGVRALTLRNKATCKREGNSAEIELYAFYTAE